MTIHRTVMIVPSEPALPAAEDDAARSAVMVVLVIMAVMGAGFGFALCALLSWVKVLQWG